MRHITFKSILQPIKIRCTIWQGVDVQRIIGHIKLRWTGVIFKTPCKMHLPGAKVSHFPKRHPQNITPLRLHWWNIPNTKVQAKICKLIVSVIRQKQIFHYWQVEAFMNLVSRTKNTTGLRRNYDKQDRCGFQHCVKTGCLVNLVKTLLSRPSRADQVVIAIYQIFDKYFGQTWSMLKGHATIYKINICVANKKLML